VSRDDNADVRWLVLLLAYGLIWLAVAIVIGVRMPAPDWRTFYGAGRAVLEGTAWYTVPPGAPPNLTPPLMAPVFGGFALLPIRPAFLLWTGTGIVATLLAAARVARTWRAPTWQVAAVLLACHGMAIGVALGQLHLLMFVLVTTAWLADREDRTVAAGTLLGAAVYLKPFVALIVLYWLWRRAWRAAAIAAAVAATGYGIGVVWAPAATSDWFESIRSVTWQYASVNLSVWGWAARLDLPTGIAVALVALVLLLLVWRLPALTRDGAWFAVLVAAYLISPIAWIYYALALTGPLGVVYQESDRRRRRLIAIGYMGLCVPLGFQMPALDAGTLQAATLGSWYMWAIVCCYLGSILSNAPSSSAVST
jgi:hypothetical protein